MSDHVVKRGYAYRCGKCGYVGERKNVASHIYKNHIPLDCSPYYCTMCNFRASTLQELHKHTVTYREHLSRERRMKEQGKLDLADYLKQSLTPVLDSQLTPTYMEKLSRGDSNQVWSRRRSASVTAKSDQLTEITEWAEEVADLLAIEDSSASTDLQLPLDLTRSPRCAAPIGLITEPYVPMPLFTSESFGAESYEPTAILSSHPVLPVSTTVSTPLIPNGTMHEATVHPSTVSNAPTATATESSKVRRPDCEKTPSTPVISIDGRSRVTATSTTATTSETAATSESAATSSSRTQTELLRAINASLCIMSNNVSKNTEAMLRLCTSIDSLVHVDRANKMDQENGRGNYKREAPLQRRENEDRKRYRPSRDYPRY